jgi:ribose 5-phosphate isomerase RpiB
MRIGIATDHGGFPLKEELVTKLRADGHESYGLPIPTMSRCWREPIVDFSTSATGLL